MASARQRFLAADDEDELMALQKQMQKTQATPSATVTRIQRKHVQEETETLIDKDHDQHRCSDPQCSHDHHHHEQIHEGGATSHATPSVDDLMAAMQNAMKGIVGEVQERTIEIKIPPQLPKAPSSTGSTSEAFPAAVHRKQSKFSLARQVKDTKEPVKRVSFGPTTTVNVATATTMTAPPRPQPYAVPALSNNNTMSEAESIAAETNAMISSMSPEQLEAAREEVLSRLPPSAAEFLRKRGAQKAAAATAAAAKEASEKESSAPVSAYNKTSSAAATTSTAPTKKKASPATFQPTGVSEPPTTSTPSPFSSIIPSRLRFNLSGEVISLKPLQLITNTAKDSLDVVSRDPLRQSERRSNTNTTTTTTDGSSVLDMTSDTTPAAADEGYTVQEACVLARSTVFQQRVFALKLLRSVLLLAKPTNKAFASNSDNSGEVVDLKNIINLIEEESYQQQQEVVKSQASIPVLPKLYWIDLWRHALHDIKVPLVLRVAFDDPHAAVVTAAAEALAVLLSPGVVEKKIYSLGNTTPLVSWPMVPLRHMQRQSASSGVHWIAAPVDLKARRERKAAAAAERVASAAAAGVPPYSPEDEEDEEESDDIDEKELARVDPMTGLLNMELVERIAYVLGVLRPPGSTGALLTLLESICYAGQDAVKKVVETPGVLNSIANIVLVSEEKTENEQHVQNEAGGSNSGVFLRLQTLKVLRKLCQMSPLSAQSVASYPSLLPSTIVPIIFKQRELEKQQTKAIDTRLHHQLLLEALQIWRCLALYGFHVGISFDDAYPALCLLLTPSLEQEKSGSFGLEEQWEVAREIYVTLAQVVARSIEQEENTNLVNEEESVDYYWISNECCTSIAQQTLHWIRSLPLVDILSSFSSATREVGTEEKEESKNDDNSAVAIASAVGAALYFLSTHYSRNIKSRVGEEKDRNSAAATAAAESAAEFRVQKQEALTLLIEAGILSSEKLPFLLSSKLITCLESPVSIERQMVLTSYASMALSLTRLETVFKTTSEKAVDSDNQKCGTPTAAAVALAPFTSPAVIQRLAKLTNYVDSTLLQPWDMPVMQSCLELSRCIITAVAGGAGGGAGSAAGALAALEALPPGAEDTALQLMAHCFSVDQLKPAIVAAFEYLEKKKEILAPLAASAACGGDDVDKFGQLPSTPSVEIVSKVLLAGYAAIHLGFVQENEDEKESRNEKESQIDDDGSLSSSTPAAAAPAAVAALSFSQALLRPELGSTLPLPRLWPLQHSPTPPPGCHVSAPPSLATAYALLWRLGMTLLVAKNPNKEFSESLKASMSALKEDIKAAVLVVFDREQVEDQWQQRQEEDQQDLQQKNYESEVWREPLVRWTFAALVHHNITQIPTEEPAQISTTSNNSNNQLIKFTIPESKRLVDGFCSSSYGDIFYGTAIALLFHSIFSPLDVQLDVLGSLVDGKALHLLPSVDLCPGERLNYFDAPSTFEKDEERENKAAVDTYVQILTTPEALKCVESDSIALSVVLHRLAKSIFKCVDEDEDEEESVDEKKQNVSSFTSSSSKEMEKMKCSSLLCSAIRRLKSSRDLSEVQQGMQILSMLLRWSWKEGIAIDVVSAGRMEFIENACGTDETGELLNTAMDALHS